jgi:carboxyl-terminal processing protease
VYPDRYIEPPVTANITSSLAKKLLLFDYATHYRNHHDSIPAARKFKLTDADYNDFIKFLADKDYDYSTDSEKNLEELKAIATKDKYFDNIKNEFEQLGKKLKHDKNADLIKFKPEIQLLLEKEIVARYYFQKGRYEYSFSNDPVVADAISVLNNPVLYASILKGEGEYKVIGKPKK